MLLVVFSSTMGCFLHLCCSQRADLFAKRRHGRIPRGQLPRQSRVLAVHCGQVSLETRDFCVRSSRMWGQERRRDIEHRRRRLPIRRSRGGTEDAAVEAGAGSGGGASAVSTTSGAWLDVSGAAPAAPVCTPLFWRKVGCGDGWGRGSRRHAGGHAAAAAAASRAGRRDRRRRPSEAAGFAAARLGPASLVERTKFKKANFLVSEHQKRERPSHVVFRLGRVKPLKRRHTEQRASASDFFLSKE